MPANTEPIFVQVPAQNYVQIATANTGLDGSGTLGTLATGVADGKTIEGVRVKAAGTTTAGMIRFFLSLDGGTTKRLIDELDVAAITPSATVKAFSGAIIFDRPLVLPDTNGILYCATEKAETFNVFTLGDGDY